MDKDLHLPLSHAWEHYKNTPDKSHSTTHIQSVLNNAKAIAKSYPELNPEDVEYAAVLHDIGRETEMLGGTNDHEIIGVHLAMPYLSHLPKNRQDTITQAIRNHRNAKGRELSLLDHVIQDADRIPQSPEESVRRIHDYRLSRGSTEEDAARRGYHYLRHNKMVRLDRRTDGLHTPEGKALMGDTITQLEEKTRTFKDYVNLIPGVDRKLIKSLEFKRPKTAGALSDLKADLVGEHAAIALYDKHIKTIDNKPIVDKLTEIRDEERQHAKEVNELISDTEKKASPSGSGTPAGTVSPNPIGTYVIPPRNNGKLLPPGEAADALRGKIAAFLSSQSTQKAKLVAGGAGIIGINGLAHTWDSNHESLADIAPTHGELEGLPRNKFAGFREDYRIQGKDGDVDKIRGYAKANTELLKKFKFQPAIKEHLKQEAAYAKKDEASAQLLADQEVNAIKGNAVTAKQTAVKSQQDAEMHSVNVSKAKAEVAKLRNEAKAVADKPKAEKKAALSTETLEAALKTMGSKAKSYVDTLGGDTAKFNELTRARGYAEATTQFAAKGSPIHTMAGKEIPKIDRQIEAVQLGVRKARVDTALGTAGTGGLYAYNKEDSYEPKYANEHEEGGYTLQFSRTEGLSADAIAALETIRDDDKSNTKKKLVGASLAALAGVGLMAYGKKIRPESIYNAASDFHAMKGPKLYKALASYVPFVGGASSAYYAYQNKDNPNKCMLGTVGALAGLGATMAQNSGMQTSFNKAEVKSLAASNVGAYTMVGAFGYASHKAQALANSNAIATAMSSDAPIEEVAGIVNTIRERKTLDTKYPAMRHIKMPALVKNIINTRFTKPAGSMSGEDMAYYFQSQVDTEYKRLLRKYEDLSGRATQATMTQLKNEAHDNVTAKFGDY